MHTGKGKDGYKKILEIVEETDIPITQFRPTHVANQYDQMQMDHFQSGMRI